MDVSPAVIGIAAASVSVPFVFGLLRNTKALQPEKKSDKGFEQLKMEYAKWESFALIPILVFTPALGLLLWYAQKTLSNLIYSNLGDSVYLLTPIPAIWMLPAMFVAIILMAIPMHYLYLSILGKSRYTEYTEYTNLKHGMDGFKALKYLSYALIPVCIAFSVLGMDSYLRITQDKFISNKFFGLGAREFAFNEITEIKLTKSFKTPVGNIMHGSYYSISFIDDYEYSFGSFDSSVLEVKFELQEKIVFYLLENSGTELEIDDPYPEETLT